MRELPAGCYITNIKRGTFDRRKLVYATLRAPDGRLIISATLDYIVKQLNNAEFRESGALDCQARE